MNVDYYRASHHMIIVMNIHEWVTSATRSVQVSDITYPTLQHVTVQRIVQGVCFWHQAFSITRVSAV